MFYLTIGILTTLTRNKQSRAEKGVANPPRALANVSPPRRTSALSPREVPPHLTGRVPSTGPTMALYRDIVASRPPSLREETTALISARSSEDAESPMEPDRSHARYESSFSIARNQKETNLSGLR
jgi:hypothetical protein